MKWLETIRYEHGSFRCWLWGHDWQLEEDFSIINCRRCHLVDFETYGNDYGEAPEIYNRLRFSLISLTDRIPFWRIRQWFYSTCDDCHRPDRLFGIYLNKHHRDCIPF